MMRKLHFAGLISLCTAAAMAVFSSCAEGGRVIGQRTFLWHAGEGISDPRAQETPNPFRGRVAPTKPRVGTFGGVGGEIRLIFADDPLAIRYFEGDPKTPVGFQGAIDPLDPELDRILNAPDSAWTGLIDPTGNFTPIDVNPSPGIQPLLLNTTFPADFGGDYSGEIPCVDPISIEAVQILDGSSVPSASSHCIRGSVDIGPDAMPGTPDDVVYTAPSIVRMTGGAGESPFRPAPDRSVLLDPATNNGFMAQGLFYPTLGMRTGMAMDYERNVDPATGYPLVARTGTSDIGSCAGATAGPASGILVSTDAAVTSYSTAYASHPLSVTTGVVVDHPVFGGMARGGIGIDPDCLRPGGAPGAPNALLDFDDGIDDDLANTNALHNHHANQGLYASLCASTRSFDFPSAVNACAFTIFNDSSVLLPQLLTVPFSELLAQILAGGQAGGGATNALNAILSNQKFDEADTTPPLASLNSLFNDPRSPLFDRNDDGGIGVGPNDLADCESEIPAVRGGCDLKGFDGFDGRVAILTEAPFADLRPDGRQKVFQTLDNSLTNEQRALGGCGPLLGTRCDSSANVNPILNPLVPGALIDPVPKHYAAAGGLDPLNAEASALLESVRAPTDLVTTTDSDAQPGTVDFATELLCMRRLVGGELVRLPGCRGISSYTIVRDLDDEPVRVDVVFDADYLPSVDGCVVGDEIRRTGGGAVPVVAVGASAQLAVELPLCSRAERERAVPEFLLAGFSAEGEPILSANPSCTGVRDGALFGQGEPGTPAIGNPGVSIAGELVFDLCESELVTLDSQPLIHPLAGCIDSDVWFSARAGSDASDTGLPFGGCEYFYQRDLVEEFLDGSAQLFRSEMAAMSWNLITWLTATSCDAGTPDPDGRTHRLPPRGSDFPLGAIVGLRADLQCFDAERPFTPGRCSYATPQLCKNVIAWLGVAPPLLADATTGDSDADGTTADGNSSGVAGDRPCRSGEVLGCDDNCADLANAGQTNSNSTDDDFGNVCDPDFNNDGTVDMTDRVLQDECFLTGTSSSIDCADADLVGGSLSEGPDPAAPSVDGFDRLQLLRWLRDPSSAPGSAPGG